MHRRSIQLTLACLFVAISQISVLAQDFKLWNRTVQVHGFASQGFVYSSGNNWLTMNSTSGSAGFTDFGINMSSPLTDKLRVGAQLYDRNLGQLGQYHPSLDWGGVDYRFKNWLGIRAGKVKTTLGLYNDSQDLDCLHVFALLPQGIYPVDLRDTGIAHTGADLYGNISLGRRFGEISYTAFAGHHSDSIYSGFAYSSSQDGVMFRSIEGPQYGGDLRWNTPVKGLLIGASRMNEKITGKGSFMNPLFVPQPIPYRMSTEAYWRNQFYSQFKWRRLELAAEYRRYFNRFPCLPGSDVSTDARSWYVSGSYRIGKHLSVGSYYSHYTVTEVSGGIAALFIPTQTDTSLPRNHVYDKVVAARVDLNRYLYVKIEGHFMDGYGIGPFPNGFYPQQNPKGFAPNTNALVVKTGFHF